MRRDNTNWELCYVSDNWAWFTTHELDELSGDDWDDAPYQCNGSVPYSPTTVYEDDVSYLKVAFDGALKEAHEVHGSRNNITTNDIVHRQSVPWLQTDKWAVKTKEEVEHVNIFAGISLDEFEQDVTKAGGIVYYPNRPADVNKRT